MTIIKARRCPTCKGHGMVECDKRGFGEINRRDWLPDDEVYRRFTCTCCRGAGLFVVSRESVPALEISPGLVEATGSSPKKSPLWREAWALAEFMER